MAENITGILDFSGGVNQAVKPGKLAPTQLSGLVNATLERGLRPRPKFHEFEIEVLTEGSVVGANGFSKSYQEILRQSNFQLMADQHTDQGIYLLVMKAGVLFQIDIDSCTAVVLNTPDTGIEFDEYQIRYNWSYAGRFLVIYDYPNYPIIVENEKVRRSSGSIEFTSGVGDAVPSSEVPPSCLGAYNQNRLTVASNFNEFVIGDPVSSGFPDAPITFHEVFVASAPRVDQFFSVGNRPINEEITFVGNLNIADNSTGIGPLVISTTEEIWAYRTDLALPTADQNAQGFGTLLISNHGMAGPRAAANVGFDFIYVSSEGDVRSLNTSRQQQPSWSNTSISEEVHEYLKTCNKDLMRYAVVAYSNNRVFITVNPYRVRTTDSCNNDIYDVAFKGMIVLETATRSGLAGVSAPVWAGLWQGISPMEIIRIKNRLFIMSKDPTNVDRIYELIEDSPYDIVDGEKRYVKTRIYSREFGEDAPQVDKEIVNIQATFDSIDISANFRATSYFKPKHSYQFHKLQSVTWKAVESVRCKINRVPSGVKQLNMGGQGKEFASKCDVATRKGLANWRAGRLMIEIEGDWDANSIEMRYRMNSSSGTPEFVCDNIAKDLEQLKCDFLSDWRFYSVKPTVEILENEQWQDEKQES